MENQSGFKKFQFSESFYFLPVFFFTLAGSPNITGWRIGLVLISVFIFLMPSANFVAFAPKKKISSAGSIQFSFVDALALLMFFIAIYCGWEISWQFSLLQIIYVLLVVGFKVQRRASDSLSIRWIMTGLLQGGVIYSLIYIGLNQYSFSNLLRLHVLSSAILSSIMISANLQISELWHSDLSEIDKQEFKKEVTAKDIRWLIIIIVLLLAAFTLYFAYYFQWRYAGFLGLALLPSLFIQFYLLRQIKTGKRKKVLVLFKRLNLVLSFSLIVFFIYFFLDSTQILQAILGGY